MDQIDKKTLLLCAETLVVFRAYIAALEQQSGGMGLVGAAHMSEYGAQVERSQPAIDRMRSLISADPLHISALNKTLSLVLESVANPSL